MLVVLTLTSGVSVAIVTWRTVLAVKPGRVIGAVDTLSGHVITGVRSSVTLTRCTSPAIVLHQQQTTNY